MMKIILLIILVVAIFFTMFATCDWLKKSLDCIADAITKSKKE